ARSLVDQWDVKKTRQKSRGMRTVVEQNNTKWIWWECCAFIPESGNYSVGGYLTNSENKIKCWMGSIVEAKSEGEAYLIGLEDALQFLLEEINATHEEFTIIGYHKDILLWLKGETNTS
ncbi:hypothetical protein PIB30_015904, partial [Stylosanthes scabra]|nr:hypothetical protein [Stylosanthes scabra]